MGLKQMAISIGIGAALSSNFSKNITTAGNLIDNLKNKTIQLQRNQSELKKYEKLQLLRKDTRSEIVYSQKELVKLKARLSEVDKNGNDLKSTYKYIENEVTKLSTKKKELENRLQKVSVKMKEGKGNNVELRREYNKLKEEAKSITSKLEPLEKKLNETKKELSDNSKESKNLTKQHLKLETIISNLRDKQRKNITTLRETTKNLKEQNISVKDVAHSYEELEKKAQRYNKAMERYNRAGVIKEKAGKVSSAGTMPLKIAGSATLLAGSTFSEAVKAESAFASVKKQFDFDTAEEEAKYKEDLLKLVAEKRIAVSLEELYEMAANAGQSGLSKEESIGYIEAAANMGMAFNMNRDEASEYMFAWRNTFGMDLKQLKELTDQINTLGNNTGATETKISEFITRMGNIPTVVGMATNQTAALGASLMEMGMAPEVAATGAKRLLTIMNKGMAATGSEKKALDMLGLDPEYLAKATLEDPEKALEKVFSRLSKLSKDKQGAVMTMLFGEEGKVAGANIMKSFERFQRNLSLVKDPKIYSGATNKEAEVQKNTTANQLQVLKTEFDVLRADLGTELLPLVKEGAVYVKDFLEKLLKMMKENPEGFKRMIKLFIYGTGALYGFGGGLKVIGGLMNAYAGSVKLLGFAVEKDFAGKLVKAVKLGKDGVVNFSKIGCSSLKMFATTSLKVGTKIGSGLLKTGKLLIGGFSKLGAMGMTALASPTTWIILAIVALVAAGYALYKNWDKVKEKAVQLKDKVLELVDKYWFLMGPVGQIIKLGKILYENWDTIKEKALQLKEKIVELVVNGIENWQLFKEKTLNILAIPFDWIEKKIDWIKEKASHMLDGVLEIYEKIKNFSITDNIKNGTSWIEKKLSIPQFATGGIVNSPTLALVGEGRSAETIIPHERTPRSLNLWERTGELLGAYNPSSTTNNNSTLGLTINYSPVINGVENNNLDTILRNDKANFERWFMENMKKYENEKFRRGNGR